MRVRFRVRVRLGLGLGRELALLEVEDGVADAHPLRGRGEGARRAVLAEGAHAELKALARGQVALVDGGAAYALARLRRLPRPGGRGLGLALAQGSG